MSLPSCFRHHPDVESEIAIARGDGKERRYCKVCMRVRAKAAYRRIDKIHTTAISYGVLPRLTWAPPEFSHGLKS
jgi:hypothetical protein